MAIDFEPIEEAPGIDFEPIEPEGGGLPSDMAAFGRALDKGETPTRGEERATFDGQVSLDLAEVETPFDEDSWAEVLGRSVMTGLTTVPTSVGAINRFTNDLLGTEPTAEYRQMFPDIYDISQDAAEFWTPETGKSEAKHHVSNIVRTMTEMGSVAAFTGGAGLLPAISVSSGVQKYAEASEEGAGFVRATAAGATQGAIEYATEKLPIGILLKPGLSFGRRLALGLVTDIPGELLATTGEMAIVDIRMLGKRYTLKQYLAALKDTAITAAGVTGGMTAATHPFIKQVEDFQKEVEKDPEKHEATFEAGLEDMAAEFAEADRRTEELDTTTEALEDIGMDSETARAEAERIVERAEEVRGILTEEEPSEIAPETTESIVAAEDAMVDAVIMSEEDLADFVEEPSQPAEATEGAAPEAEAAPEGEASVNALSEAETGQGVVTKEPFVIFHDSPEPGSFTVKDEGMFGGIFAGPDGGMGGEHRHAIVLDEESVLTTYALEYELSPESVGAALKRAMPWLDETNEYEYNIAHEAVIEDGDMYEMDTDAVLEVFRETDIADASWEAQRIRGQVARELGYKAVEMSDETGVSYLVLPGVKTNTLKAGESTGEAEARVYEEWKKNQGATQKNQRVITDEAYENARAQIKEKLKGLKAGVDPTVLPHMIIVGAYHVESGLRTFSKWSAKMTEEYGEKIKPHLRDIWKSSNSYIEAQVPARKVEKQVRQATGLNRTVKMIREDKALAAAWKKAEQSARKAFKAGKVEEAEKWKLKMKDVIAASKAKVAKIQTEKQKQEQRRRQIKTIIDYLGLTEAQVKKLTRRRNFTLMTDYEYKKFKDDMLVRAVELQEQDLAKARVMEVIERKRLEKVDNFRRALELPTLSKMTTEQMNQYADLLEEFHEGDVFLTQRELETVDRTDLKGIRTWREAKESLASELGVKVEDLDTVNVSWLDKFRYDTALAEANPFYGLLVTETHKKLLSAETRVHEVENKIFELARKSEKSRKRGVVGRIIPQDKQVMDYLEAPREEKDLLAAEMTPEQLDLAHYMQEYFGQALEYLMKTKSLERGRENYFVHMRRSFLEAFKEDGLLKAVAGVFQQYQQDEMVFNILDEDTGNILPLEKFFQYSMRRTGALEPTSNVVKAFLAYARTFEKKVSLDELIPKLDIYAQSLTPRKYTPRGLEVDRSIKKFVNKYVNNKKGRYIDMGFVKQGDKIDLTVRGLRTLTTMLDLGFSIPVGLAAFVGEGAANFTMLGPKAQAKGKARARTKKGKAILRKYESFVGRSVWEEFTAPGKEVTERLMEGAFGLFHRATVSANKTFLLGSLTKEEYDSGTISDERLAVLKVEMGRLRVVPGSKSLVGSTSPGGAFVQYKRWAVPVARTLSKDITTLVSDLRNKPTGEALTTREAREIYRAVGLMATVVILLGSGDEDDKSFAGQLSYKIRREALTLMQGMDPKLWLSVPRILTFMAKLGDNLHELILLEEYKTKPGLKGAEGLKKQFTPAPLRQLEQSKENNARR